MRKISIIIPVYNEEGSVNELYAEIKAVMKKISFVYEVIFINDGSRDSTLEELKKLAGVKIISFTKNFGKSQALQAGFDEADGEYIITLDGDLQDDPKELPNFINSLEQGDDLVCGWKYRRLDSFSRRFASFIANSITKRVTKTDIHDMNCCYKGYKRETAKRLRLYGDMHRYIPAIVSDMGLHVNEIKVHHRQRMHGKTKYGFKRLSNGLFDFMTLLFLRRFIDRPMHFFGLYGLALLFFGSVILLYLFWIKVFQGVLIGSRPLLILGMLLVVVGVQSFSLGCLGELIIRQNGSDRRNYVIKEIIDNRTLEVTNS
ncbi:MAG: glycosyltransferase family 2 protein [Patescibacteria group bacterium]|jgi:glycosyltransferase involved in cell wall biosynthesis